MYEKADLVCLEQGRSQLTQQMIGSWYNKESGKHMGEIFDEYLYWNVSLCVHPTFLHTRMEDMVETDVNGRVFVGKVSLEAQATITWDDGQVWLRK